MTTLQREEDKLKFCESAVNDYDTRKIMKARDSLIPGIQQFYVKIKHLPGDKTGLYISEVYCDGDKIF